MREIKLLLLTLFIVSCSSDNSKENTPYDYTGEWNLSSMTIYNTSPDYLNSYEFKGEIQVVNDCLTNSVLSIYEDNSAILRLTSKVEANMEIVDGTFDELQQTISCENIEEIKTFTWELSDAIQTVSIGTTTADTNVLERIKFFDEHDDLVIIGTIHNGDILYLAPSDIFDPIYVNLEDEIIEFFNGKYFYLLR